MDAFGQEQHIQPQTHVTDLILINTKQKNDMVQRGYHLKLTNRDYRLIEEDINRFGKVSAEAIATKTPELLSMGMAPDLKVGIDNGWQTERFIFIMKTKTQRSDGSVFASYIQGYTNYLGANKATGQIDPNMIFYVNSIVNVIETVIPGTNTIKHMPHSAFTLVYDRTTNMHNLEYDNSKFRLLRPIDTLIELHTTHRYGDYIPVTNVISKVSGVVDTSKANNRIGANQVTDIINATAASASIASVTNDPSDIYMGGAGTLAEPSVVDTPFMREISTMKGMNTGEFTYNDIVAVDPGVQNKTSIRWTIADQVPIDTGAFQHHEQNILLTNDPETLAVTSQEARIASTISESASALASKLMLTSIMFTVQTGVLGGVPVFTPLNYNTEIPVLNVEQSVIEFEHQFMTLILPQLTLNNTFAIDILVNIDLINESRISVSVNGQPPIVFAIPTYSNSLFDPVITTEEKLQSSLKDYQGLLSLIVEN